MHISQAAHTLQMHMHCLLEGILQVELLAMALLEFGASCFLAGQIKNNVNTHVVYITNTYIQSTLNIQGHILFGSTTSSNSRTSCVYIHAHTNTHTYTIKLLLYNTHIIITSPSLKPKLLKLPCGFHHPSYPEQACIK